MAQKKITDLTARSDFDATCNVPVDDTSATWRATGQQILDFIKAQFPRFDQSYEIDNLTLSPSVAASALTLAVKTKAGANASATDPISVAMRSSTLTSGVYNLRTITGALSMVVSSGSTLGQIDTKPANIYAYLIDNAGTLELAVSHALYPEDSLVTTVAEGGAGAADSATAIYSTTQRTSVPCRYIGYILNTQTTAGTWASAGTQVQLAKQSQNIFKAPTIQNFTSSSGTYYTPAGVKYIRVRMVGGGGGGGGSGSTPTGTTAGTGGTTSFGTALLSASGGVGGASNATFVAGGAASLGTGPIGTASQGGNGSAGQTVAVSLNFWPVGGVGGSTPFGGGGGTGGGGAAAAGGAGIANTGAGGGGACGVNSSAPSYAGAGGGAGGFVDAIIGGTTANPLLGSYAYAVGAAGSVGAASASGAAGGLGGSGYIEVTEYYN